MVKVREDYPTDAAGEVDVERWLDQLEQLRSAAGIRYFGAAPESPTMDERAELARACALAHTAAQGRANAGSQWQGRRSPFLTGLEMAQILTELQLDTATLSAAILYRVVREGLLSVDAVRQEFGDTVAGLIEGVLQMVAIATLHQPVQGRFLGQQQSQVDNIRRMLVTMIDDVRVALLKLAERTCVMRDLKDAPPDRRHRVAREVFDVYAPLAHRLGIGHLKWELEDLSFRYLHERAYKKIARLLDERRLDRQHYIRQAIESLTDVLRSNGVEATISGRAKHIYSIWRKMHRKGIDFSRVYDIRAVRILVREVRDCYAVLGLVHGLWRHIPHEFDDYIANPKPNGYQSLHTAVVGPGGKVMEIQIRTVQMHEEAELGVCAHWVYKGADIRTKGAAYEQKIAWLRQVLEWQDELGEKSSEMVEQWRKDVTSDRIYVFTPEGHVLDLPAGATPLDFAYKVHTEVGHRFRGAKVNGRIVPLKYELQTGEQIEVLTSNQSRPSRDWLNPDLGYVTTSRARAKISHWFKQQDRDQNIREGQEILTGALKRLRLQPEDMNLLAQRVNFSNAEDMYAAIGGGDLKAAQVVRVAQSLLREDGSGGVTRPQRLPERVSSRRDGGVRIRGVGNLLTSMANCCRPVPGDDITGYITQGRGVTIHRTDCLNALQLRTAEPNRMIEVSWGEASRTYPVDIVLEAYDRSGLLKDITVLLANEGVNLLAAVTHTNREQNIAFVRLTLEIPSLDVLVRIFDRLRGISNVIDVHRASDQIRSGEAAEDADRTSELARSRDAAGRQSDG